MSDVQPGEPVPTQSDGMGGSVARFLLCIVIAAALAAIGLAARWPFWDKRGQMDMLLFAYWGDQMTRGTFANAYRPVRKPGDFRFPPGWPDASNYPPGNLYACAAAAKVFKQRTGRTLDGMTMMQGFSGLPGVPISRQFLRTFKAPAVFADIATGVALFLSLRRRVGTAWAATVAALFLLQPGVIYNSARWGQVDAIHTLFMVLSLEFAARRRYVAMSGCAILALLCKMQAILLAPVWGLCLLLGSGRSAPQDPQTDSLSARLRDAATPGRLGRILVAVHVAAALAVAVCAPFFVGGAGKELVESYTKAIGSYPYASVNAFNLWSIPWPLRGPNPENWTPDTLRRGGLSLHAIGQILLLTGIGLVVVRTLRRPEAIESLRWAAVALCLVFFTLPTQIHERYLHPAVGVAAWAFVPRWWWWPLWLGIGLVYAVNLMWFLPFEPDWVARSFVTWFVNANFYGYWPSQTWGLLITLLTVATLAMPLRLWRASCRRAR